MRRRRPGGGSIAPVYYPAPTVTNGLPVPLVGVSTPSQSFGISQPQKWSDEITAFEQATRVRVNTVMFYMNLYESFQSGISKIIAAGKTPMLTLLPFTTQAPLTFDGAGVTAGNYDATITAFARALQGRGIVRFAHEMNIDPSWGPSFGAANYIAMWNHVRSVWQAAETAGSYPHAPWCWCPNISSNGIKPFEPYYPGDAGCEIVGLDGYSYSTTGYPTLASVFDYDLTAMAALTSKPVIIGETGFQSTDPNRADHVASMFTYMATNPNLKGFNWFEHNGASSTGDDRLLPDPASAAAFRQGVAAWAPGVH